LLQKKQSLEESNFTKDMLFSIIAHDIKNPFSTVLGFSELLQTKLHDISIDKIQKYIGVISESSHKIYRLLENLLEWSRAQLGTISIEFEVFKAFKLASDIQDILKDQIQVKNNQLIIECDPDLELYSDFNLLNTIIRNLVSNANKYTEAAKITISFKQDLDRVIICVADKGTGIPGELKKNLFKIVKDKSHSGTRGEQGTGLGLVICHEFTLLLNGEIWVESEVGIGTSFYISIPAKGNLSYH
ncbi:MAG: HAMP domain-containing histidine kinase, partial [Bacteroidales bacterium]|nr:HAMP domain-containing histidine kinase [Bacteroidales bacterium]